MIASVSINYLAVLVAAIAGMVIGALWYSPVLFAKPWMKALGKSESDMESMRKGAGKGYAVSMLGALVLAYVLVHFIYYVKSATGTTGLGVGLSTGFWAWLGFEVTSHISSVVFEGRSIKLYYINMGYHLVELLVMGAILASWT